MSVLSLSKSVVIAFHSLLYLLSRSNSFVKADEIASFHKFSVNHLSKVLWVLSKHGVVESVKGPFGGYRFKADSRKLSLLDVYELFEGQMIEQKCFLEERVCGDDCMFQSVFIEAQRKIQHYFRVTTFQSLLKEKSDVLLPV